MLEKLINALLGKDTNAKKKPAAKKKPVAKKNRARKSL